MYVDIKIQPGDIVRRKSDNMLCYMTHVSYMGTSHEYTKYYYQTEKGTEEESLYTIERRFDFVARQFMQLKPFDKIFIWKSRRWLAEIVSSCDEKYVWTLGHGRVLIDDIVPFIEETKNLFGKTDRSLAMKMHRYVNSREFLEHIEEIKKAY